MSKGMRYKTTVTYVTGGREYRPGDILPADISPSDLAFLKSKKFAVPAESEDDEDGYEGLEPGERGGFSGFDEQEPDAIKSPAEIRKIRSKKAAFNYASSIGLDFEEGYEGKRLEELQEEIINFQEEQMAGEED